MSMTQTVPAQSWASLQSRIARLSAQNELRAERIKEAQQKALEIFGTDNPEEVQQKIEAIKQRNLKREAYRTNVYALCQKVVQAMESGQSVAPELIQMLESANQKIQAALTKQDGDTNVAAG